MEKVKFSCVTPTVYAKNLLNDDNDTKAVCN